MSPLIWCAPIIPKISHMKNPRFERCAASHTRTRSQLMLKLGHGIPERHRLLATTMLANRLLVGRRIMARSKLKTCLLWHVTKKMSCAEGELQRVKSVPESTVKLKKGLQTTRRSRQKPRTTCLAQLMAHQAELAKKWTLTGPQHAKPAFVLFPVFFRLAFLAHETVNELPLTRNVRYNESSSRPPP